MSCLTNIIGITRTENPCFTDAFSEEAAISTSGLYLDEITGFPSLKVFADMAADESSTLEKLLMKAREDGVELFKEELYKQLGLRYMVSKKSYVGNVGNTKYNTSLNTNYPYTGLVLDMKNMAGAEVKVKGIKPFFNFDGNVTIKLYKAYLSGNKYQVVEEMAEYTIPAKITAPALSEITPITLSATDEEGTAYSYLWLVELANGQYPRDNSNSCGCGNKEAVMSSYLKPYGINGNTLEDLLTSSKTDKINGIYLNIEARCTGGDFICQNYNDSVYLKTAIEHQIQRISAAQAMTKILTSDLINRYTLLKGEEISHSINILNSVFKKNMIWVAENMNMLGNDCFVCNTTGDNAGPLGKVSIYT